MAGEKTNKRNKLYTVLSVMLWLLVWQLASMAVGQQLFLPSPLAVISALFSLLRTRVFWASAFGSLARIGLGFLLGFVVGCLLAVLAAASRVVEILLRPLLLLVRATPVASFVVLALIWFTSRNLSVFISFLMVLPVIYSGMYSGIGAADKRLLEMARVFRVPFWRRLRAIYLPALLPSLLASCELAVGLAWKSGVAAELIGNTANTIGERLYQAKLYLLTPELFAWTLVIILLSWAFAKAILALLRLAAARLERGYGT